MGFSMPASGALFGLALGDALGAGKGAGVPGPTSGRAGSSIASVSPGLASCGTMPGHKP